MKLSIVIVNYNVQYFLENCLHSVVKAGSGLQSEIFVVDNNSVDGSLKMLKEKFPQVKVIANKKNLGFSRANNQAIRQAKGEYILLLNPDTVVEEETFVKCIAKMDSDHKIGGMGVKMMDGKGNFLPESKRGLPTPAVAFYKIFGLSSLFPRSKRFGQYHFGHLSKDEDHEIDVLSGAFMLLRRKVLDEIGLLDEDFFMYGEDIDLSYRITKAGYKNLYFSQSSIIHYKGESTKKSSINYVFVFYKAMAIFAKKHFSKKNAQTFSDLINIAIYLRAGIAVFTRFIKRFALPAIDAFFLYFGMYFITEYYENNYKFIEGGEYPEEVVVYGLPAMVLIILANIAFSGGYSTPLRLSKVMKGAMAGILFVFIIYALLDENYRFSRAIVLMSALWAMVITPLIHYLLHLARIYPLDPEIPQRVAIVGNKEEIKRITSFLQNTPIEPQLLIYVQADDRTKDNFDYHGKLYQLPDIIEIYELNEVIFCSADLKSSEIIRQMTGIRNKKVDFKIAPPKSMYIIGSNSIASSGSYYLLDSNAILKPVNLQNKRSLDLLLSTVFIFLSPLLMWFTKRPFSFFNNLCKVFAGYISFVGFKSTNELISQNRKIRKGILTPIDMLEDELQNEQLIEKLNFQYGNDYSVFLDLKIIFSNFRKLGREVE